MLSLWKLRVGAENYYLGQVAAGLDDYYAGAGEMPGRWLGAASGALGMGGEVAAEDLRAVLAGLRPGAGVTPNGDMLRTWRNRVPGFDLTFAAPKSVSVLYALADPLVRAHVVEAADAAIEAAIGWLEREACWVRRGSNNRSGNGSDRGDFGTRRLPGAGFVAAGFRHRTSRAGDPHLHTHVLVGNLTRGPDGRWSALDAQGLYRSKRTAGVVYQTVLRDQLTGRLGVRWGPIRNDVCDIAGIPQAVLTLFSKRLAEIEAELARRGAQGAEAARAALLATRHPKVEVDGDGLTRRWCEEAATVGFGPDDIDQLLEGRAVGEVCRAILEVEDRGTRALVEQDIDAHRFAVQVTEMLVQVDSTFTRHDVVAAVARMLPGGATVAGLERVADWVLAQPEMVPLPTVGADDAGWEQRWTSRRLLAVEAELMARFTPQAGGVGEIDSELVEAVIAVSAVGSDQAATIRQITGQGLGVEVIVGRAGTGKTYTMDTVRAVYERAGYRLVGVAPSARAARELSDGAGMDAYTMPRFMRHAAGKLTDRHVVVIDEAGMAGTIELHQVVTAARSVGAKVIVVGDHHQLPEVTAGGGFAAAVAAVGDRAGELTVNRRQHAVWERDALDQLRHGHVGAAFAAYLDHQRVVVHPDPGDVHTAAVRDWLDAHRAGHNAVLLAGTRAEARALNRAARAMVTGQLTGPVMQLHGREFRAGDQIVLLRNDANQHDLDRRVRCRVDNGMIATITAINTSTDTIDIELRNGRRLRLGRHYLLDGHIDHGYATTIHKAQGVTCDTVFVVGPAGLYREAGYVAMSRARHGARIYATTRQAADLNERPHHRGIPLPSEHDGDPTWNLRRALGSSRAKSLALSHSEHLPEIADLAASTPLDQLTQRARHIRDTTRALVQAGHTDLAGPSRRLQAALKHRRYLQPGGRVKALDWDNVGTIAAMFNDTGRALVEFISSDGLRHRTKTISWADLQPIDDPDPAEDLDTTVAYFRLAAEGLAETVMEWNRQLDHAGIGPDEPVIVTAAIEQRRRQLAHALAAHNPTWLTRWLGSRPGDHAGSSVYHDELTTLAAWRDHQHLNDDVAGYGPEPDDPTRADQWRQHLDRSLGTRMWLRAHQPELADQAVRTLDATEIRERLTELDTILHSAPPDQRHIIDALHNGELSDADLHQALTAATGIQAERRQWILEHWPYVVEHAELTRLDADNDPLAHWPTPLNPPAQQLYDTVAATTADTPQQRTLSELDAQLDAINPHRLVGALNDQLDAIHDQRRQLRAQRANAGDRAQAALLDTHINRLSERCRQLETEHHQHSAAVAMWNSGSRPRHLTQAINQRTNHLAHQAIVDCHPWVIETVRTWAAQRPISDAAPAALQRLINEIAAYRERAGHNSTDPLGPPPDNPAHLERWQHLDTRLNKPPAPRISDLLTR